MDYTAKQVKRLVDLLVEEQSRVSTKMQDCRDNIYSEQDQSEIDRLLQDYTVLHDEYALLKRMQDEMKSLYRHREFSTPVKIL